MRLRFRNDITYQREKTKENNRDERLEIRKGKNGQQRGETKRDKRGIKDKKRLSAQERPMEFFCPSSMKRDQGQEKLNNVMIFEFMNKKVV